MPAAGLTTLSAALRTRMIPHAVALSWLRAHGGSPPPQVPSRLSRVLHLHQACMDTLEVARPSGRRQAAPTSHSREALVQLGVRSSIPALMSACATPRWPQPSGAARCSPSPAALNVWPPHELQGISGCLKGQGEHVVPAKWTSTRWRTSATPSIGWPARQPRGLGSPVTWI